MRPAAQIVRPDVALILGVLANAYKQFQNFDQYAEEKAVLLESLAPEDSPF